MSDSSSTEKTSNIWDDNFVPFPPSDNHSLETVPDCSSTASPPWTPVARRRVRVRTPSPTLQSQPSLASSLDYQRYRYYVTPCDEHFLPENIVQYTTERVESGTVIFNFPKELFYIHLVRNRFVLRYLNNDKFKYEASGTEFFSSEYRDGSVKVYTVEFVKQNILHFTRKNKTNYVTSYMGYKVVVGYSDIRNYVKSKKYTCHSGDQEMADSLRKVLGGIILEMCSETDTEIIAGTILNIISAVHLLYTSWNLPNFYSCLRHVILGLSTTKEVRLCIDKLLFPPNESAPVRMHGTLLTPMAGDALQEASLMMQNPILDHMDTIVSVLVMCGFVEESKLTVGGIKMFATSFPKNSTSRDMGAKVLDALSYLSRVGTECFTTRSFVPIMDIKTDLAEFSRNVLDIDTQLPSVIHGNYDSIFGKDSTYFQELLENTMTQHEQILRIHHNASAATLSYIRMLGAKLHNAYDTFRVDQLTQGSRIRPICIKYYGDTARGKSYINQHSIIEILKYNNYPSEPKNIVVVTDEKFDSTVKSNSTGIIMDDLANTVPERDEFNVAAKLIRFVNNVCAPAVKAEAQDKGKVLLMPKVVGITTNSRELAAGYWSICPASILRRCDIHVDVYLRPEFMTPSGLIDSEKVQQTFSDFEIHDIYILRVMYYDIVTSSLKNFIYEDDGRYPELDGKPLEGISLPVYYHWLYQYSSKFFKQQVRLQTTMKNMYECTRCTTCNKILDTCSCVRASHRYPSVNFIPGVGERPAQAIMAQRKDYEKRIQLSPDPYCSLASQILANSSNAAPTSISRIELENAILKAEDTATDTCGRCTYPCKPPLRSTRDVKRVKLEPNSGVKLECQAYSSSVASVLWTGIYSQVYNYAYKFVKYAYFQLNSDPVDMGFRKIGDTNIMDYIRDYHDSPWAWNQWVPKSWMTQLQTHWLGQKFIKHSIDRSVYRSTRNACLGYLIGSNVLCFSYRHRLPNSIWAFNIVSCMLVGSFRGYITKEYLEQKLMKSPDELQAHCDAQLASLKPPSLTEKVFKWGLTAATLTMVSAACIGAYKTFEGTLFRMEEQVSVDPKSEDEVKVSSKSENIWNRLSPFRSLSGKSDKDYEQFGKTISKNLRYFEFRIPGELKSSGCNGLFLRTDELIIPKHVFQVGCTVQGEVIPIIEYRLTRALSEGASGYINGSRMIKWKKANATDTIELGPDLLVLRTMDVSGDVRDLSKPDGSGNSYFIHENMIPTVALVASVYRNDKGSVLCREFSVEKVVTLCPITGESEGPKAQRLLRCGGETWKKGDCCTTVYTRTRLPMIVGFHLYGSSEGTESMSKGYSFIVTKEAIDKYIASQPKNWMESHCLSPFPTIVNNRVIEVSQDCPKHSPINYVKGNFDVLGFVKGSDHYSTNLQLTQVSDKVKPLLSKEYDTPDFKTERPFDNFLEIASQPSDTMEHPLLVHCADDYLSGLKEKLPLVGPIKQYIRPLTNMEILNGIPNVRFLDRMKGQSAMGFPYKGKRNTHTFIKTQDQNGETRDFTDQSIWTAFESYHEDLRKGNTLSHPFRSSLKDEIRKKTKRIPRVFQAAPLFLQLFLRKYYLPLTLFLSTFPLQSECAVGINSLSKEWHDVMTHVSSFGEDRVFAGDYSNWDMRFEKELANAVYYCLLEIAVWFDYTEDDLVIMRTLKAELMNPVLQLFGTIVRLGGSNPSGQNLTAYVNSIGNSLKIRYMAYKIDGKIFNFRSACHLLTYGDDMICGVNKTTNLNFITYKNILEKHSQKFTLPTKEVVLKDTAFLPWDKCDFLKRKSVFIPELGYMVGALELESIYKSCLYFDKTSNETEAQIIRSTMESMSFELCAHGEDIYNQGMSHFKEWASHYKMLEACAYLEIPYLDKVKTMSTKPVDVSGDTDYSEPSRACPPANIKNSGIIGDRRSLVCCVASRSIVDKRRTNKQNKIILESHAEEAYGTPESAILSFNEQLPPPSTTLETARDKNAEIGMTPDVSLSEFLSRPIRIGLFTWNIGANLTSTINPFFDFMNDAAVKRKIDNYAFIQGTMHVKFITTGSPFHFGKLIACLELLPDGAAPAAYTSLPHVFVDPTTATGGVMTFPIMTPFNGQPLLGFGGNLRNPVTIWLRTLNTLQVVGDSTSPISVTVYAWMTDVRLKASTLFLSTQAGEREVDNASLPSTLWKMIVARAPAIEKYTMASMMAIKSGMEIASLFGFSRPTYYGTENRMLPIQVGNLPTGNLHDCSVKLALDSKNETFIDEITTGVNEHDDMLFEHIVKRDSVITQTNWSPGTAIDTILIKWAVTPTYSVPTLTNGGLILSPLSHVASCFRYWRGTICYRIEVVCSPFHRGKLRIVYDPYSDYSTFQNTALYNQAYSHIIDLSTSTGYEFCVGHGVNSPYLRVPDLDFVTIGTDPNVGIAVQPNALDFCNGWVTMIVASPLTVGVSGTTTPVGINIWAYAGDDLSFGQPTTDQINVREIYKSEGQFVPGTIPRALLFSTQLEAVPEVEPPVHLEPQALQLTDIGSSQAEVVATEKLCLNMVPETPDDGSISGTHMGERVLSLRQLLKRYCFTDIVQWTVPLQTDGNLYRSTVNTWNIPPNRGRVSTSNFEPTINNYTFGFPNFFGWFHPSYMAWRGSSRWKYFMSNADDKNSQLPQVFFHDATNDVNKIYETNQFLVSSQISTSLQARTGYFLGMNNYGNGGTYGVPRLYPTLEIETPYYGRLRFTPITRNWHLNTGFMPDAWKPNCHRYNTWYSGNNTETDERINVCRFFAVGDDFSFFTYKCAPVVYERPYT